MLRNSAPHLFDLDLSLGLRIQTGCSLPNSLLLWQGTHALAILRVILPIINTALLSLVDLEKHTDVSIGILPDVIFVAAFVSGPATRRAVHIMLRSKTVAMILQGTFRIMDGVGFKVDRVVGVGREAAAVEAAHTEAPLRTDDGTICTFLCTECLLGIYIGRVLFIWRRFHDFDRC